MTIHCIHCGTALPDSAQFCLTCGKSPRGEAAAVAAPAASAPRVSAGGGAYDPTVLAGPPPGNAYGAQLSVPPPPPPPSYSDWQPSAADGAPPPPVLAPTPPQQKQRGTRGTSIAGAIVAVLILASVGLYFALQHSTPITNVQIGTGDANGTIQNETTTFTTNDLLVITFTVTTQDSTSEVELLITDPSNQLLPVSDTLHPQAGTSNGYYVVPLASPGTFTVELQYNHTTEYTSPITVTC